MAAAQVACAGASATAAALRYSATAACCSATVAAALVQHCLPTQPTGRMTPGKHRRQNRKTPQHDPRADITTTRSRRFSLSSSPLLSLSSRTYLPGRRVAASSSRQRPLHGDRKLATRTFGSCMQATASHLSPHISRLLTITPHATSASPPQPPIPASRPFSPSHAAASGLHVFGRQRKLDHAFFHIFLFF